MEFFAGILVGLAAWPAFWLVFVIMALGLSTCVINERGGWATIFTIGLGVMIAAQWQAILTNPLPLILGSIAYLVLGVFWARFKWSRFLSYRFDVIARFRDRFLEENDLTRDDFKNLTGEKLANYRRQIKSHFMYSLVGADYSAETIASFNASLAPKAVSNKGSIVMWIVYWPVTAIWYIAADIVIDICKGLYNMVGGHFQKMSDSKFNQL
jgi:hypothetical protein